MTNATLRDHCNTVKSWAHHILDRARIGQPMSVLLVQRALVILGDIK